MKVEVSQTQTETPTSTAINLYDIYVAYLLVMRYGVLPSCLDVAYAIRQRNQNEFAVPALLIVVVAKLSDTPTKAGKGPVGYSKTRRYNR